MLDLKVVNTTRYDWLIAVELRLRQSRQFTPAMREQLRTHDDVLRVIPGNNPTKVFVLTSVADFAENNNSRADFVNELGGLAAAAA